MPLLRVGGAMGPMSGSFIDLPSKGWVGFMLVFPYTLHALNH